MDQTASSARTLAVAGAAAGALGAAIVHAAVIGPHAGHDLAPGVFAAAATAGVLAAIAVMLRPTRVVVGAVAVCHLAMVAAWVATRTSGIGALPGFEEPEAVGFADAVATGLEVLVVACCALSLRTPRRAPLPRRVAVVAAAPLVVAVALLAGPAAFVGATSGHDHGAGGDAHGVAAPAHSHGAGPEAGGSAGHAHVEAQPFDPGAPVDLSGTPGVTQVQEKRAELLLAQTLQALPAKFADPAAAVAAGYSSIGDSMTGDEHYIRWDAINDEHVLDPDHPESLVYDVRRGAPRLEAAMFILPDGFTLENVPDVGGPLIQWHVHDNLCFTTGAAPQVAGVTSVGGPCAPGLERFPPHPMIHVWVAENPCGPFAALEGVAAGQTKDGTRACDHAHGSSGGTF